MSDRLNAVIMELKSGAIFVQHLPFPPILVIQLHSNARIRTTDQTTVLKVQNSAIPFDDARGKRLR